MEVVKATGGPRPLIDFSDRVRVLYSFPHKLGADRICYTAWQQVKGLANAGADVLVFPGALHRTVQEGVRVQPTLARGKFRLPYKALGSMRSLALHDFIVARRLRELRGQVDIVHTWPSGAVRTLKVAVEMGIPSVLERPSANTQFVYDTVRQEYERLSMPLAKEEEFRPCQEVVTLEEEEFRLADYLLCASDFVVRTFQDSGFPKEKLLRHQYGFDDAVYRPDSQARAATRGLKVLFVGFSALIKGLHHALAAWLNSPAHRTGTFVIVGTFTRDFERRFRSLLSDPSVVVLGRRDDVPDLMRKSDILLLPSLAEGYGLVVAEALGSGCVPLASEACTEICRHMVTGLVHRVGDVQTLTQQITLLHEDRGLLARLSANCLSAAPNVTWTAAGTKLLQVYRDVIAAKRAGAGAAARKT
ncbi:MAG TPA: glycosyltransferase [Candidatus Sulfotelmatobacter sp.]|nr:glycosyltransferase [Candidatus Sulfotelmatobacter sp.]